MYIKGTGMTKFGVSGKLSHQLAYDSCLEALNDADTSFNKIDAVVCSSIEWFFSIEKQRHFAGMLSSMFRTNKPIIRVPAGCAGGGHALWVANQLGYDNVLIVGVEKLMTCKSDAVLDEFMMAMESRWEQPHGLIAPASAALVAGDYLNRFPDTTTDDLALISYKNHSNGFLNPKARFYKKKVSLEDIKNSKVAASPLRVMDCSISVDGAAAVVLSKDKSDIEITGSGLSTDRVAPFESEDMTRWDATCSSSEIAFKQAGCSPKDIDFAELHDAFTIVELISYEDLGFARKGEGARLIRDGIVNIDGRLPVNASGGLKAKGHPPSATGLSQIHEIAEQMRGEAGDRQLTRTNTALAHNIGGVGGTVTTHVIKKR
ncbi:thiolase family protein [Candidatus Woesearchaeota archaeon]|nr:thiolase family protein [Candidatus Woesearchaeota archaeon]